MQISNKASKYGELMLTNPKKPEFSGQDIIIFLPGFYFYFLSSPPTPSPIGEGDTRSWHLHLNI